MKARYAVLFAVTVAAATALSCAPATPSRPDVARDSTAIAAVIGALESANNAGDVDAWVSLFADGAVYMPPGSPAVATRESLRAMAAAGFSYARTNVSLVPVEITLAGDWAFARVAIGGEATLLADGGVIRIDMKELIVFRRQPDGAWRIARLINNRNME